MHQLKGDLDWIVMKALEKDRTRRYETANGLAADLKRHLSNETVVARPPSSAYRFQKLVRRNKLAFAAGVAIAAALLLGTIASPGSRCGPLVPNGKPWRRKPANQSNARKPKPTNRKPSRREPKKPNCARTPKLKNSPPGSAPMPRT